MPLLDTHELSISGFPVASKGLTQLDIVAPNHALGDSGTPSAQAIRAEGDGLNAGKPVQPSVSQLGCLYVIGSPPKSLASAELNEIDLPGRYLQDPYVELFL